MAFCIYSGSPPLMRGKQVKALSRGDHDRITPAHAGKTPGRPMDFALEWITPAHAGKTLTDHADVEAWKDHPRSCGENANPWDLNIVVIGSPPLMRGKRKLQICETRLSRITPAHAGKTFLSRHFCSSAQDHPRSCGENVLPIPVLRFPVGSPPLMRGKQILCIYMIRY